MRYTDVSASIFIIHVFCPGKEALLCFNESQRSWQHLSWRAGLGEGVCDFDKGNVWEFEDWVRE